MIKYLKKGWLPGIPARNLTKKEVEALGLDAEALTASGLYESSYKKKVNRSEVEDEKKEELSIEENV